jgi:hypothetical protein
MLKQYIKWGERKLEKLSKLSYHTAKFYYHFTLQHADQRYEEPPLLVYQMGKVGSKTVVNSLGKAGIGRRIYHIHFLSPALVKVYEQKRRKYLGTSREGALQHIWQYSYLRKCIEKDISGKRWKVITLVRDPVARNLATFFENIEVVSVDFGKDWVLNSEEYGFQISVPNNDLNELINLFFEKCRHNTPLEYYDREFKAIFDIDVYATQFPTSKGYEIYTGKHADVLLIRLEDLNQCISSAIKEFLDINNLTLLDKNIGEQKDYADLYKNFKNHIRLPDSYLDKLYRSKFCTHFYEEEEISRFRSRWSKDQ